MLVVGHCKDRLLHQIVESSPTPDAPEIVIQRLLLRFLDEQIIGREFPDVLALQTALNEWYFYAAAQHIRLKDPWIDLQVSDTIIRTQQYGSDSHPIVCGHITRFAAQRQ